MIYGIAFALIATKFLDCYTTAKKIRYLGDERNPWARRAMQRYGTQTVIWGIFALTVAIVLVGVFLVHTTDCWWYEVCFLVVGSLVAIIQAVVAWANHTGRQNRFIRWLSRQFQGR